MDWNGHYRKIAEEYLEEIAVVDCVCVTVGGSVGRSEADEFSDVDMNIYVSRGNELVHKNLVVMGEIFQIHILPFPSEEIVKQQLWQWRFLQEESPLVDETGVFAAIKRQQIQRMSSYSGMNEVIGQVSRLLEERKAWARRSQRDGQWYSAAIAAMAAWIDGAFFYAYAAQRLLATASLLPFLEQNSGQFARLQQIWSLPQLQTADEVYSQVRRVERYRAYLRENNGEEQFITSPLQDLLTGRKIKRALQTNDFLSCASQLYSEAFFLYLDSAIGLSFEDHMATLPTSLQEDLHLLGLHESENVEEMCAASDEFLAAATRIVQITHKKTSC